MSSSSLALRFLVASEASGWTVQVVAACFEGGSLWKERANQCTLFSLDLDAFGPKYSGHLASSGWKFRTDASAKDDLRR